MYPPPGMSGFLKPTAPLRTKTDCGEYVSTSWWGSGTMHTSFNAPIWKLLCVAIPLTYYPWIHMVTCTWFMAIACTDPEVVYWCPVGGRYTIEHCIISIWGDWYGYVDSALISPRNKVAVIIYAGACLIKISYEPMPPLEAMGDLYVNGSPVYAT